MEQYLQVECKTLQAQSTISRGWVV